MNEILGLTISNVTHVRKNFKKCSEYVLNGEVSECFVDGDRWGLCDILGAT